MKSAVTVSLVPEARGGPFVFWDGLEDAFVRAAAAGFDGVELFPPSAAGLDVDRIRSLCQRHGLQVAAVGTGAGWTKHRLSLTDGNPSARRHAREFAAAIVERAGELGAPAIIGSMQGRWEEPPGRALALDWLGEALDDLGARARVHSVPLFYEFLNRYETNLCVTAASALEFLAARGVQNVQLLCDLFHMNIEEPDLPAALRCAGAAVGHVHFADSNRRAAGFGHTDLSAAVAALRSIGYAGYLSAEVLPLPDSAAAAAQAIASFRALVAS